MVQAGQPGQDRANLQPWTANALSQVSAQQLGEGSAGSESVPENDMQKPCLHPTPMEATLMIRWLSQALSFSNIVGA